jgi:ATP-dependent DNA ligase
MFVWLKDDATTIEMFTREEVAQAWVPLFGRVNQLATAHISQSYPPKPYRLCKKYCPVASCPLGRRITSAAKTPAAAIATNARDTTTNATTRGCRPMNHASRENSQARDLSANIICLTSPVTAGRAYILAAMRQFEFQPCIPTRGTKVPAGPDWLHEIKHDGYRLIVQREGELVRLFTRRGYDWTYRYPLIVAAARRLQPSSFVIDGEAVVFGEDGLADFERLHARMPNAEVGLVAFDLLAVGGEDIRRDPLHTRKARLKKLLAKSGGGIQFNPYLEGEIGPAMFEHACKLGHEGIVSKHRHSAYKAGRCAHWIKVKNPESPAMKRGERG